MNKPVRRLSRKTVVAAALAVAAAWVVPSYLSAERYRRRVSQALERALHRPVEFGSVSFRLLPHPGFIIQDVVVKEEAGFGVEPFARVERIEGDLRWRSLWRSRLDLGRLELEHPSFNFVINPRGEWNVESLLQASGLASPGVASAGEASSAKELQIDATGGRINFKAGADKKPFAIADLEARIQFDPVHRRVRFRMAGAPLRSDLPLPTPGVVQLTGEWAAGAGLDGLLDATLRSSDSLLYDWIPLVTGRNPEIYGVLDGDIHLTGSLRNLHWEGQCRVSQLHRWDLIPPLDTLPVTLHFRGRVDNARAHISLEGMDASWGSSELHLTGSVDKVSSVRDLDLVVALEHSRLEDWLALGRRFWKFPEKVGLSGRVDGLLTVQGPWASRRYGGFIIARELRVMTPAGTFPVSEAALKIDAQGVQLAPLTLTLAPRMEVMAEGALALPDRTGAPKGSSDGPRYELTVSTKSVPLREVLRFAGSLGLRPLQGVDARGVTSAVFHLAGPAWPLARPALTGHAEIRSARLLVPGLTEPLNVSRARVEVKDDEIVVDPVVAVLGTSVFTGRLEHRGERQRLWNFAIRANVLSLDQGSLWFEVLGHRQPAPLLERLRGFRSSLERRAAGSTLFGDLNARGSFSTPALTYRTLALNDFQAHVEISGRLVKISGVNFRAGGGRGEGRGFVDLSSSPARLVADFNLSGGKVQSAASHLPEALRGTRGTFSAIAHLESRGLSHEEITANLQGKASLRFQDLTFAGFDPLDAVARAGQLGTLEPARGHTSIHSVAASLQVAGRRVILRDSALLVSGARLSLAGTCSFDGSMDLNVHADLRHLARRWLNPPPSDDPEFPVLDLHLGGTFNRPILSPQLEVSKTLP